MTTTPPAKRRTHLSFNVLDMAAAQAVQITGSSSPDLVVRLSIDPGLQGVAQGLVRDTIAAEGERQHQRLQRRPYAVLQR